MKTFLYTAAFAAAMLCPAAYTQTLDATANVPFSFRMGTAAMPPGDYRIHESGGLLTLREENGKGTAMHLTRPASRRSLSETPSLLFTRYGNELYLSSVWAGMSHEGQAVIPGKYEKELAARFRNVETASVTLQASSK